MENVKPWQIILMIAAVCVLGFSVWKFGFAGKVQQPDSILLVDVMDGQLYDAHKGSAKGMLLPARSPTTGDRTLFPVEKGPDGVWRVRDRYLPTLETMNLKSSVLSGDAIVTVKSEDPIYFEPKIPSK